MLVLAGDIANGADGFKLFSDWRRKTARHIGRDLPILYVAGNHEYYGHVVAPKLEQMRQAAEQFGIHFLENRCVVLNGVRFLGATLWTDYQFFTGIDQAHAMEMARQRLNDHQLIRTGRARFSPQDALSLHVKSIEWLKAELTKPFAGKTVVISHHGVHPKSVHPRFRDDLLTAAFVSDLTDLLRGVDLWMHGHVHDSFDYYVGSCRVVANPAGYVLNRLVADHPGELRFENAAFNKKLLVDL